MRVGVIGFCEYDTLKYMGNSRFIGSGALSTAIHIALYGVYVSFFTYCGLDFPKSMIYAKLKPVRQYFSFNDIPRECTAVQVTIKKENHDHTWSIVNPGAWNNVKLSDFEDIAEKCNTVYIKLPYHIASDLSTYIAKDDALNIAINPQGVYFFKHLKGLAADLLFFSEREICSAAKKTLSGVLQILPTLEKDVVITIGNRGAVLYNRSDSAYYYVPPFDVDVVDTLGCGDAFAGGFIASQMKGEKTKDQLAAGILCATLNTQTYGALPDPLLFKECEEAIRSIMSHIHVFDDPILFIQNMEEIYCSTHEAGPPELLKKMESISEDTWKYD